ncbi:UbiX family flavin prenyltransferase [Methanomethylovorans sp.]|uniref:UbiX family flavin prenyltransferase n=1 Tax=Methanomethylovorans sp. TaxID=2758717 RepID=UPI00345E359F
MEIVVGISGASGSIYGIRLLEILSKMDIVTHLVITRSARQIIEIETDYSVVEVEDMASYVYEESEFTAPIASGSYRFHGMIVAPCSMKTVGSIANGMSDNLLERTADVCLKERRRLVVVPRETPLNEIHLENMIKLTKAGAIVMPACPGLYSKPKSIDDLVNTIAGRALDLAGIDNDIYKRWR